MTDYQEILDTIYREFSSDTGGGKVADYIPALAGVDPASYAISVTDLKGNTYSVGDADTRFSIQSISKIFTLAMVSLHTGEELWQSVGKEPSGTSFNSLVLLEREEGIPRNPFINPGAIVVTDRLIEHYSKPKQSILDFVRKACGQDDIYYDKTVAASELATGHRNMALACFMKDFGNIHNDIEEVMDVYCHQCSIAMNTRELSSALVFLANKGISRMGEVICPPQTAKRLNALMLTCGLYNESGDFAYRVGLPGKSGVGGGIVAVVPGEIVICVWSPELNVNGNSYRGIKTLERFTSLLDISIF